MLNKATTILIFFLTLCGIAGAKTQDTAFSRNIINTNTSTKKDTSLYNIIYYHNNKTDYLIDNIFDVQYDFFLVHYYDKTNIPDGHHYLKLNTLGSASKDMIFQNRNIFDYNYICNNYIPYTFNKDNVKYFQNKKAYTSLSYSSTLNGSKYFNVNFAKNIYKGLNIQTDFFVNYADGEFANSQIMNQFLNVTLNYISPSGRYRANFAGIRNRAYIQENGGITHDSVFINQEYSKPNSYPTNLTNSWSKQKSSEFIFSQTYRLSKKDNKDINIFNAGAIIHSFSYHRYNRRAELDSVYTNDSLITQIVRNSVFWTNDIKTNKNKFFIPVSFGVNYDFVKFTSKNNKISSWLFIPEIKTGIVVDNDKILTLNFAKNLSSDFYKDNYQLDIAIPNFYSSKYLNIYVKTLLQSRSEDFVFYNYLNKLPKTKTITTNVGIDWKKYFTIEASYTKLTNFQWFDKSINIHNGSTGLWQVKLKNDFSIKDFRFKGFYVLQKAKDENVLHLPLIAIKQGMAYSFTWMKGKLNTDIGIDLNYFSKYKADEYNYKLGMYVMQSNQEIGNYLFANIYLNLNIDRFCLFVMLQHPYANLINHSYFNSPLYPAESFTLRYGLTWKLLD